MSDDTVESADPRVFLAIDRTFLAWTRTSLSLIGFGFVVARIGLFLREVGGVAHSGADVAQSLQTAQSSRSLWLGAALVALGVVVQSLALLEHAQLTRRFKHGEPVVPLRWPLAQVVGFTLIVIGAATMAYLLSL